MLQTVHLKMVNMVNFMLYVFTTIKSKNLKKKTKIQLEMTKEI